VSIALTGINRFPVKSCRGHAVRRATVERWGLLGDRRWMVVDEDGKVITAREAHALLLVDPLLLDDGLSLSGPDVPPLLVRTPDGADLVPVEVWGSRVSAAPAGAEADAWFTKIVGSTARLVYLDDPTRRPTNPSLTSPDDRVSFADAFPLLLTTEESLAALNDLIAEGPLADEGPLPMLRFRPNVVVRGVPAWAEDDWRRIRIGQAHFRVVKGCDRCVLTTLDPVTAIGGMEPIATLARHRRWAGKTWFGVNLVPDSDDTEINVGDEVDVVSAVEPGKGPLR
jgi:uncharacterized protein YcbX